MSPSATAPANKVGGDGDEKSQEVGNSQLSSNVSVPSLLMSEGVVSPVEDEEDRVINDSPDEDADSDTRQQLQQQLDDKSDLVGIPSMTSSSDWEIEGRGEDYADTFSLPPTTTLPSKQTKRWLRSAPSSPFHNENANDDINISNDDTTTSFRSSPIIHDVYATPPNPPYTPTRSETPLSYYNRSGVDNQSWLDPFPTPDISLHSRQRSNSFNHLDRAGDGGGGGRRSDNNNDETGQTNKEWDEMIKKLPKLPTYDEFETHVNNKGNKKGINKSCPELDTLDDNIKPFRRVSTEASIPEMKRNLSLNTLLKRPSMEEFWTALRDGPDGNGIDFENDKLDDDWDESILRISSSVDIYRQDSDRYELVDRDRKKNIIESRQSAPLETTDEWEGIRRRIVNNQSTNVRSNGKIGNNSVTLTNVTGSGLAKEIKLLRERRSMTPGRFRSFLASPTVSRVRTSAQERVISPVKSVLARQGSSAATLVRNTRQKLAERKERRRQRRMARLREPMPSWWIVIPADHPYKIAWDVLTMLWSLLGAYRTHIRIRDRVFDQSPLIMLTEIWFTLDIMLNFVTEHKTRSGEVIRDGKTVWARYLTTWFLIDALSLIPWERIYVRPIVEKIKRRNIFQKTFFRSRAVVRVSRVLRGRHIKLFGRVSRQTGTPLRRMVTLIIKYVPKYLIFLRNMKGALAVRSLRLIHWLHNIYKKIWVKAKSVKAKSGIYFRRKSTRRKSKALYTAHSAEESQGDDESDYQDDESESGNDEAGDYVSENEFRDDDDDDEHMTYGVLRRAYSDSVSPVQRRRCYSSVELSNL